MKNTTTTMGRRAAQQNLGSLLPIITRKAKAEQASLGFRLIPKKNNHARRKGAQATYFSHSRVLYFSAALREYVEKKLKINFPCAIQFFSSPGRNDILGVKFVCQNTPDSHNLLVPRSGLQVYINLPEIFSADRKFVLREVPSGSAVDLILEEVPQATKGK